MKARVRCPAWAVLLFLSFPHGGRAVEAARLVCDVPVFNFGRMARHASVTNVFKIRNEGGLTFAVKSVRTACSCTRARIDRRMIAPGEGAEVAVVYTAGSRAGQWKQKVFLVPEDSGAPALTFCLEGFVESPAESD